MATRLTPKQKQQQYRRRLRRQGLRPVQIWVPDTRTEGFAGECRKQALRASRGTQEKEALNFIEAVADWGKG